MIIPRLDLRPPQEKAVADTLRWPGQGSLGRSSIVGNLMGFLSAQGVPRGTGNGLLGAAVRALPRRTGPPGKLH